MAPTMPAAERQQWTILVVDDDPGILKFVSGLLVYGDYHVLTASSGAAALQQSRDYKDEIHDLFVRLPNAGNERHRPETVSLTTSGWR